MAPPVVEDEEIQLSQEEPEEEKIQHSQEELEAVLHFVKAVGGWNRAMSLIKEVHEQCAENQNA